MPLRGSLGVVAALALAAVAAYWTLLFFAQRRVLFPAPFAAGGVKTDDLGIALVLESTFTSVRAMAARLGLPGFLVRDPFDNRSVVSAFGGPVLLLHGAHDEVIDPAHAQQLHAAAPASELHLLPCGHNDCERPWEVVGRFLARHDLRP
jgi:fermentation-respiration switch protein FrsA (DUF1100 family)